MMHCLPRWRQLWCLRRPKSNRTLDARDVRFHFVVEDNLIFRFIVLKEATVTPGNNNKIVRTINKIDIFQCGKAEQRTWCMVIWRRGGDWSESERKKLLGLFLCLNCLLVVKRQHFNCNRYNEENLLDFCTDEQFPIRCECTGGSGNS